MTKTIQPIRVPSVDAQLLGVLQGYRRSMTEFETAQLLEFMWPVVRGYEDALCFAARVQNPSIYSTWSTVPEQYAERLSELARIYTIHSLTDPGKIRPTFQEVLTMIPSHLVRLVKAFEVVGPKTASDLARQRDAVGRGYQVAVTILYQERKGPVIY